MCSVRLIMGTISTSNTAKYVHNGSFEMKKSPRLVIIATNPGANIHRRRPCSIQCTATTERRSGNYTPPLWDFGYIQSLTSQYTISNTYDDYENRYSRKVCELVEQVVSVFNHIESGVEKLELIDDLQRLGISHHFHEQINHILKSLYHQQEDYYGQSDDLYSTALAFRLLRHHGFSVSQEVFDGFKNDKGEFEPSLGDDTKGLLQLYEASFLLTQGEKTLELAREFASNLLHKKLADDGIDDHVLLSMVRNALELPLHWRIQNLNARWFILDVYANRPRMNPFMFELAKLDFNIVQSTRQQELKHVSRWWKETSIAEKLPFARDRVVESYILTLGQHLQPQYGYSRIMGTKVNTLVTTIDDIFDVYGTPQELQLFNHIIQRWDIEAMDQLPEYMQICFLALNNFINEMAYDVLKEQGFLIIPYLKKSWADLCASYSKEAKWYSKGYTPTLEEYISNAWISMSVPVMVSHAYFLVANPIDKEVVQALYQYPDIVRLPSTIMRLANDLGTSPDEMERGDVPKSIQCYMNESGADREEARDHVTFMIHETWKKINKERNADCPILPQNIVEIAVDFGRIAHYMYHNGDGYGTHCQPGVENRISNLLFEPIV